MEITKETFEAYDAVKSLGIYDMDKQWQEACIATGLTTETYFEINFNYEKLKEYFDLVRSLDSE